MAASLLIDWDPATPGAFRTALSRALDDLLIEHADAADIDPDPDAPAPMRLVVATPAGRVVRPDADLVLAAGQVGGVQLPSNAIALSVEDIEPPHRRWINAVGRIAARLSRPGLPDYLTARSDPASRAAWALAFPGDPLAADVAVSHAPAVLHEHLAAAVKRAEAAERALASAGMSESDAVRQMRRAETSAAQAQARIAQLEAENERLTHMTESSAFALSSAPMDARDPVTRAREHAWRARLAAAEAMKAAERFPDALAWPKSSTHYAGETANRRPHGHGVMTFSTGSYRGQFEHGHRVGHGVGVSDGWTWTGQWQDEARGFGLLETDDGRRFEGEAAPGEDGAPRAGAGHTWTRQDAASTAQHTLHKPVHRPVQRALPPA